MENQGNTPPEFTQSFVIGLLIAIAGVLAIEFILMGVFARNVVGVYQAEWLEFISEFGLITLMFIAGFEVDLPILKKNFGKSTVVGISSFIIPFGGIYLVSRLLGMEHLKAILMSIALSTTSLALIFPALRQKGLLKYPDGQFILSAASIVDILSILSLTIFFIQPDWNLLFGAIGVVLIFVLGPKISPILFGRWKGNVVEMEVKFILFTLLALIFIGALSEVHAALTGFVFGVMMGSLMKEHFEVEDKLRTIVFSFFAPVFFFHAGAQMDLSQFNISYILMFLLFAPLAFGLKYFGSYFPFKYYKNSLTTYGAILFNYQLSFAIIAALFGLETGLFSLAEYSVVMGVVLATSLTTAFILKFRGKSKQDYFED
jgi:Kef-type K+ transport system membrane component KefB